MHVRDRRTVDDLMTWGVHRRRWRPDTISCYRGRAAAWLTHLRTQGVQARSATPDLIRDYLDNHFRHPATRDQHRNAIVALYDMLREKGTVKSNPAREVSRLRRRPSLPRSLEPSDVAAVIAAAASHGPMWHLLVCLHAYAALRRDEARLLQWTDVVDKAWLRIDGKGGKMRMVPLHDRALAALVRWHTECESPQWLFPSPIHPHQPIARDTVGRHVRAIGEDAGVYVTTHMLRHSAATQTLRSGASLADLQAFLGHSDLGSTTTYVRARPHHVAAAVNGLSYE